MDVSIVIVNWNSRDYLQRCIASILRHTREIAYEIVVIDSGSFDGCDRMLRECYPQVRLVQSASNLGFARANNRAFEETVGECVLFLNPDTEVTDGAIQTMYARLKSLPTVGAVGCTLLNSDGSIQWTCIRAFPTVLNRTFDSEILRRRFPGSRLWGMAPLYVQESNAHPVEAISGACLMVSRNVFEEIGRFSEDYFMYAEDLDLSYKIQTAGYTNYYLSEVKVIHHGGSSSEQASNVFSAVMMPEATWRFLRKTRGPAYSVAYRLSMCISALGRLLVLGLGAPYWLMAGRGTWWGGSCRKSRAVLQWSLHLQDNLLGKYYPNLR